MSQMNKAARDFTETRRGPQGQNADIIYDAFKAGAKWALDRAAEIVIREVNDLTPTAAVVFINNLKQP